MPNTLHKSLTGRMIEFLNAIGIEGVLTSLEDECFLPGIRVDRGRLFVDEAKLDYPGDLLHEAGHLALAPCSVRPGLSGEVKVPGENMDLLETEVTAWAFAAITHLGLDPKILFHEGGYRGRSSGLLFTYRSGVYPGAFGLQRMGMTATGDAARDLGVAPYPHMLKWLRD